MDIPAVTLDHDRTRRCGFPEAIFGEGKSLATLRGIIAEQLGRGDEVLVTRVTAETAAALCSERPELRHNELARTLRASPANAVRKAIGKVVVVTAGTTDLPVAEEARETLEWMGVAVTMVHDVGVAGPHRLPARLAEFAGADAVVVVAGMEGALPSVVGGYLPCPIIGVPTSVGYGANFGGLSALLSMLNSCAANVAVVNIDAGFKAGYMAGLIATRSGQRAAGSK
jgi:NCAIR mutase (PurE)-related protein